MKKTGFLFFLIAAVLFCSPAEAGAASAPGSGLRFREDGSFKILIIADIQDGARVSEYTMELIEKSLAAESPDLVVLLGDNVFGSVPSLQSEANVKKSIDTFLAPIVSKDVPFCLVFGNHDGESAMTAAEQMEYYQTFPGCLAERGSVTGVGNYRVVIEDRDGFGAASLVFFDSGSYAEEGEGTYANLGADQLAWYRDLEEPAAQNGAAAPAYLFQHIPVPEMYDVLLETERGAEGAVEGQVGWSGRYYALNPEYAEGYLGEGPCPPDSGNGQFAGWAEKGNVTAAFFGHDHVNDFIARYQGIDLIYTPGAGFHSYGNGYRHGVRVLTLYDSPEKRYETRMVYFEDLTGTRVPAPLLYTGRYVFSLILLGASLILLLLTAAVILLIRIRRRRRGKAETGGRTARHGNASRI